MEYITKLKNFIKILLKFEAPTDTTLKALVKILNG